MTAAASRAGLPSDLTGVTVMVVPGGTRPAPWACASLQRAGANVVVGAGHRLVASLTGRRTVWLPDAGDQAAFCDAVEVACRRAGVDVVLPLTERTTALLAARGDVLGGARLAGPDAAQYSALADKVRLGQIAARVGVAAPRTTVVSDLADARGPWECPAIIKPRGSVTVSGGGTVYRPAVVARDEAEVRAAVERLVRETGSALVQPLSPGRRIHVQAWIGETTSGGTVAEVVRAWPPEVGMACATRGIGSGHPAVAAVLDVVKVVGYRGTVSADLAEDVSGRVVLHDVNTRPPFSVGEAIVAGFDVPRVAVEIATFGDPLDEPRLRVADYHYLGGEARWLGRRGGLETARELARALGARRTAIVDPFTRATVVPATADLLGRALRHAMQLPTRMRA